MGNDKVVSLAAPAVVEDALTELLRTGRATADRGGGGGGVRGVPVGVRGRTVAGRTAAGGSQRPPSASGDPDGDWRGGGRSSEVAQPLRVFGAVSLFPGATLRSPQCESRRRGSVAVPARGVDGSDARGGVGAGGRGSGSRAAGERGRRLKRGWDEEYRSWCRRSLADDWVYVWADGIHSGLRGAGERLCVLVVIGVNPRGEKHFLAIDILSGSISPISNFRNADWPLSLRPSNTEISPRPNERSLARSPKAEPSFRQRFGTRKCLEM